MWVGVRTCIYRLLLVCLSVCVSWCGWWGVGVSSCVYIGSCLCNFVDACISVMLRVHVSIFICATRLWSYCLCYGEFLRLCICDCTCLWIVCLLCSPACIYILAYLLTICLCLSVFLFLFQFHRTCLYHIFASTWECFLIYVFQSNCFSYHFCVHMFV